MTYTAEGLARQCIFIIAVAEATFMRCLIDQSRRIYNTYTMVARDLWQCKPTSPSELRPRAQWVYCHKSLQPWYNY